MLVLKRECFQFHAQDLKVKESVGVGVAIGFYVLLNKEADRNLVYSPLVLECVIGVVTPSYMS